MADRKWNHSRYALECRDIFRRMYKSHNLIAPPFRYTVRLAPQREGYGNEYYLVEWGRDGVTTAESEIIGVTILVGSDDGRVFQTRGLSDCFSCMEDASEYMDELGKAWPDDFGVLLETEEPAAAR